MRTVSLMCAGATQPSTISVVIPAKNRAELLSQTLRSIHEQTVPPDTVLVADDGSTDATADVARRAGAVWIPNPRGDWGPARARNAALERVDTELVAFVDSDDLLLPRALEELRDRLEEEPAAPFAYGKALSARRTAFGWEVESLIGAEAAELEHPVRALFIRNSVPSSGALARTDVVRAVGGYDEHLTWSEDHHLWIRLALRGAPVYADELVCIHRRHGSNRHIPHTAHADAETIVDLAKRDAELAACLPERLGVELCEVALSTLKERPLNGPRIVLRLLRGRRGKAGIVLHSFRHWRARRRLRRAGRRLWDGSADVSSWLATY